MYTKQVWYKGLLRAPPRPRDEHHGDRAERGAERGKSLIREQNIYQGKLYCSLGRRQDEQVPTWSRVSIQTIQTIAAFTSSTIHTADTTSCAGHERKGLTPSDRWATSNPPTHREVGLKPKPVPALRPTAQCKQTEKGTHALCARTAPRVLRGSYPPVRSPHGSPGQWSFSSPGAHNGHPHRGPPSQGRSPPASADDGAATRDVLPLKASRPSPC